MSTSLWDAPIWQDPSTWIVLGISLLFLLVAFIMHGIIMKIMRSPSTESPPASGQNPSSPP